jgi:hypothetical protein
MKKLLAAALIALAGIAASTSASAQYYRGYGYSHSYGYHYGYGYHRHWWGSGERTDSAYGDCYTSACCLCTTPCLHRTTSSVCATSSDAELLLQRLLKRKLAIDIFILDVCTAAH